MSNDSIWLLCTSPDLNQMQKCRDAIFPFWFGEKTTNWRWVCTLTLHHLHCFLPFPGLHRSTYASTSHLRQHKWGLCCPWVCLQYSGSQEVSMVEGGVRRWEGLGADRVLGGGGQRGEAEFGDKASVVLLTWGGTTLTLWHCGLTKIHTHTMHCGMLIPAPPQLHQGGENRITDLVTAFRGSVNASQCWTFVKPKVSVRAGVSQL